MVARGWESGVKCKAAMGWGGVDRKEGKPFWKGNGQINWVK
jgi:hypothetical protein